MLKKWWRQAPITVALCGLIILMYVATAAQSLSLTNNLSGSSIGDSWILYLPEMTETFGPLRALGSAFMHLGPAHLILNLLLLFLLGREVERAYGPRMYLTVWLASAEGASAASVWLDPLDAVAGASGVGYSLMVLYASMVARRGGDMRAPVMLIVANIAYTLITPAVSLWGHMGGLLAGLLLSLGLLPRNKRVRWVLVLVLGLSFVGAVLLRISTVTTG